MKKTVTIILSLILVFCAFPISAFADDNYFDKKTIEYYKGLGLQGTTVNVFHIRNVFIVKLKEHILVYELVNHIVARNDNVIRNSAADKF